MSELEKAISEWESAGTSTYFEEVFVDAARRFASLTSPETIEKAAKALAAEMLRPVVDPERDVRSRRYAEAVLRSVEEGET